MTLRTIPVTISAGSSMSAGVDCSGSVRIVRIVMPSDWTYATLSFQMSPDGVTFHDLYHISPGTTTPLQPYPVSMDPVVPNAVVAFPVNTGASVAWVKLRSGTSATPVKQAADRTFQVVVDDADAAAGGGTGPAGPTGPAGVTGPTGSAGALGSQGAAGPAGVTGPAGVKGATGPAGTASTVGTVAGDEAAPGNIGEHMMGSQPTPVTLTSGVTANVVTLALTPGDWQLAGNVTFDHSAGATAFGAAISQISAALPTEAQIAAGGCSMHQIHTSLTNNQTENVFAGVCRVNVSVATTVYLVFQATFGTGTGTASGRMSARRMR